VKKLVFILVDTWTPRTAGRVLQKVSC